MMYDLLPSHLLLDKQTSKRVHELRRQGYSFFITDETLNKFKDSLVKIGNIFFEKTGQDVVFIRSVKKYFRKNSPLLVRMYNGNLELRKKCVKAKIKSNRRDPNDKDFHEGFVLIQDSVKINDSFYLRKETIVISGKTHSILDKDVVMTNDSGTYEYVSNSYKLSPRIYGKNKYVRKQSHRPLVLLEDINEIAYESDSIRIIDSNNKIRYLSTTPDEELLPAFVGYVTEGSPDFSRIKKGYVSKKDDENFIYYDEIDRLVHKNDFDQVSRDFERWFVIKKSHQVEKIREACNQRFSDTDDTENKAIFLRTSINKARGGETLMDYRSRNPIISPTSKMLGGMDYTFGVEIETAAGEISDISVKKSMLGVVGDGSIGGHEYITSVLHGDVGVNILASAMQEISRKCFVDDSCSIHIHVGGNKDIAKIHTPSFNRKFSVLSIMLGTQIEEDLFRMNPKSRDPHSKYCAGIAVPKDISENKRNSYASDFRNISFKDWKQWLGLYVFGGERFSTTANSRTTLSRWPSGRYKWLNLVNCNTNSRFETIEFRVFSPTTSFLKTLNFLRISLAFVWFVENRQARIKKGMTNKNNRVTLQEIISTAYARRKSVMNDVLYFIEERNKKFNRTKIY